MADSVRIRPRTPTTHENIDDRIGAWHDGAGRDLELHEYLGLTFDEYKQWFEKGRLPAAP